MNTKQARHLLIGEHVVINTHRRDEQPMIEVKVEYIRKRIQSNGVVIFDIVVSKVSNKYHTTRLTVASDFEFALAALH